MNYLIGLDNSKSNPHGSYAREAYRNGLTMQDTRGYNPYKFGFVGAGDSHNTATAYSQSNYFGDHAMIDPTPEARLSGKVVSGMTIIQTGTSGLGGVWAEENTRASIFDAMKRKETFGTSGVHIKVRLFGGWEYSPDVLSNKDWVKTGYAEGRPDRRRPTGEKGNSTYVHCLGGERSYVAPYDFAVIYAGQGERDQAVEWLNRAYAERSYYMPVYLTTDARLDGLRSDPRFAELLRRVGLPE